ncbi:DUF7287 family protein [Haloarcula pellucida]|uniref:Uncharacterized protein n=1 Tax=Haloarcula pellucida TaxID=1427151 RepID=A0A830GNN4_9EURY|nr:hypothetical protein [Halomicroarcula pellucida]GGN96754.1 hypothetical protein GCM10009030_25400 [Halomicroarcula pellucida]
MRGQTTLDFAIGMSLFLAVLIFVFLFIPGLLSPFTAGAQDETVTTNRVADQLTKSTLGGPDQPYTIDRFCTVEFFDGNGPGRCVFDDESLSEQLGLDANRQHVNVTIRGNVTKQPSEREEILCWDVSDERLLEQSDCVGSDIRLARGDTPPSTNDETVTALRVVSLNLEDVTLYVEMW